MDAFVELLKLIIPAAIVLYAMYLLVRSFIQREIDVKRLEVRSKSIETVLPSRLHAYERMALFLERMAPQNLLVRLNTGAMPAREFHQLLLGEIRNEYNHNVSQQIYIGEEVWSLIKSAKEDLIVMINESANEMSPEASSLDLARKVFEKTMNKPVDPISHAMSMLKQEIQRTF
jgi:hypothetical protein